jgi:hypothetical protein
MSADNFLSITITNGRRGKRSESFVAPALENMEETRLRIVNGLREIIIEGAKLAEERAREDALSPKTGIYHLDLPNRSSAPGEVPAFQSGTLLESFQKRFSPSGLSVTVGPTVDYAFYLADGAGRLGGKARVLPISHESEEKIRERLVFQVRELIANAGKV